MEFFDMTETFLDYSSVHFHLPFEKWSTNELSNNYDFSDSKISSSINLNQTKINLTLPIKKHRKRKSTFQVFICNDCFKVYNSKENMILHFKNIHLKQKPYKCSYCSAGFSHRNGKIYHERKFHTKIFPYICPYIDKCKLNFPTKSSLKYHIKAKHLNEEIYCYGNYKEVQNSDCIN